MGNFWRIKPINDTSEEKFYYKGEKSKNSKPYNSSVINKEHVKSICEIILRNQEYKNLNQNN